MVTVCTVLPAPERPRLDAAGDGCFTTVHTSSFRDALRAARRKRVDALVLSVHACRGDELPAVARFVREFPAIPAVALVSRHDRNASETLDRKSTRLNSSHTVISYAVFCLKKKNNET